MNADTKAIQTIIEEQFENRASINPINASSELSQAVVAKIDASVFVIFSLYLMYWIDALLAHFS